MVLYHLGTVISNEKFFGMGKFGRPFIWGDSGVPFFFVLSGFLIPWVHFDDINKPAKLGRYLRKRLVRIYPLYWILFAATVAAAVLLPDKLTIVLSEDLRAIIEGLLLIPQDPALVDGTGAPVLVVAWSLQFEVFFYAVMAAFILRRWLGALVVLLVAVNFISCTATSCAFPRSFLGSHCMLLFAMGWAVAWLVRHAVWLPRARAMVVIAAALFLCFGMMESVIGHPLVALDRRLVYGALSAVLIWGLVQQELHGSPPGAPALTALVGLGDASYVLYLVHLPLMVILCRIALWFELQRAGVFGALATWAVILVICVYAALLIHRLVEKPLLRRFSIRLEARSSRAGAGRCRAQGAR